MQLSAPLDRLINFLTDWPRTTPGRLYLSLPLSLSLSLSPRPISIGSQVLACVVWQNEWWSSHNCTSHFCVVCIKVVTCAILLYPWYYFFVFFPSSSPQRAQAHTCMGTRQDHHLDFCCQQPRPARHSQLLIVGHQTKLPGSLESACALVTRLYIQIQIHVCCTHPVTIIYYSTCTMLYAHITKKVLTSAAVQNNYYTHNVKVNPLQLCNHSHGQLLYTPQCAVSGWLNAILDSPHAPEKRDLHPWKEGSQWVNFQGYRHAYGEGIHDSLVPTQAYSKLFNISLWELKRPPWNPGGGWVYGGCARTINYHNVIYNTVMDAYEHWEENRKEN